MARVSDEVRYYSSQFVRESPGRCIIFLTALKVILNIHPAFEKFLSLFSLSNSI